MVVHSCSIDVDELDKFFVEHPNNRQEENSEPTFNERLEIGCLIKEMGGDV